MNSFTNRRIISNQLLGGKAASSRYFMSSIVQESPGMSMVLCLPKNLPPRLLLRPLGKLLGVESPCCRYACWSQSRTSYCDRGSIHLAYMAYGQRKISSVTLGNYHTLPIYIQANDIRNSDTLCFNSLHVFNKANSFAVSCSDVKMGEFPAQKRFAGWQIALPPANRVYNIQQKSLVSPFSFQEPRCTDCSLASACRKTWILSTSFGKTMVTPLAQKQTGVKRCQTFQPDPSHRVPICQFYEHNIRSENGPLSLLIPPA